jgi:hypothetical protein
MSGVVFLDRADAGHLIVNYLPAPRPVCIAFLTDFGHGACRNISL